MTTAEMQRRLGTRHHDLSGRDRARLRGAAPRRRGRAPPGAGSIRVRIEATGLCRTDIHAAHGDWPVAVAPVRPGHEGVGIVEELGPGVTEVVLGERVALPWLGYACRTCDYCVSGWETLCLEQKNMGYSIDGGFGEYATSTRDTSSGFPMESTCSTPRTDVRRRHDVQGNQGRRDALVGPRRSVRRRRARPHGDPVRPHRRRPCRRRRPARREARAGTGARRRVHGERGHRGSRRHRPGGADQAMRFSSLAQVVRAGLPLAPPGRDARLRCRQGERHDHCPSSRPSSTASWSARSWNSRDTRGLRVARGRRAEVCETRPLEEVNEAIADVEAGRVAARVSQP